MTTPTEVAIGYPRWDGLNYLFIPNDVRGFIKQDGDIWLAFTCHTIGKLGAYPSEQEAKDAVERCA